MCIRDSIGTLFQPSEQGTVGLGQLVALRLQRLAIGDGLAALGVQGDGLIYQRQLGVLELFADVLLYRCLLYTSRCV